MFKYPTKNNRKQELKIINACIGCHDLTCECNEPAYHTLQIFIKQLKPELNKQQKDQLIKCLGDGGDQDILDKDISEDVGEDLERLFAEDITENDG